MLPSGLVTLLKAAAEPLETKVAAEVQLFPGRRMICEVALDISVNVCPFDWRERDDIPSLSDCGDGCLDGLSPSFDIWDIMGLVHPRRRKLFRDRS